MTSHLSKDDIEDLLVRAGIISPYVRGHIMRKIEQYARKWPEPAVPEPVLPPVDVRDYSGYKYMCPGCKERKHIGDFPEYKRLNRRSPVRCNDCAQKKPLTVTVQEGMIST